MKVGEGLHIEIAGAIEPLFVLFGGERAGLPNEAVALADAILSYPVNRAFASLNLAQAVALLAHGYAEADASGPPPGFVESQEPPATREELVGMMEHFEEELDRAGFFHPEAIRQKWGEHLSGQRNWAYPLWVILMFQAWLEAQ